MFLNLAYETWMNLGGFMLNEMSQTEKDIMMGITYMWNRKKKKLGSQKQRIGWWLPDTGGGGKRKDWLKKKLQTVI